MNKELKKLILIYALWLLAAVGIIFSTGKAWLIVGFVVTNAVLGVVVYKRIRRL